MGDCIFTLINIWKEGISLQCDMLSNPNIANGGGRKRIFANPGETPCSFHPAKTPKMYLTSSAALGKAKSLSSLPHHQPLSC